MNLADEIEKRIKALSEAPDSSKGGILLPWKIRAESELTRFLNDQACNIVDALRSAVRPEAVPTGRIEIRTNADATLDEAILKDGKAHFHLEQMAAEHWWMALTLDKQRVDINLTARGRIKAIVSDEGEVKLIDDASASPLPQPLSTLEKK